MTASIILWSVKVYVLQPSSSLVRLRLKVILQQLWGIVFHLFYQVYSSVSSSSGESRRESIYGPIQFDYILWPSFNEEITGKHVKLALAECLDPSLPPSFHPSTSTFFLPSLGFSFLSSSLLSLRSVFTTPGVISRFHLIFVHPYFLPCIVPFMHLLSSNLSLYSSSLRSFPPS